MNLFRNASVAFLLFCSFSMTCAAQESGKSKIERRNDGAPEQSGRLFSQAVKHGNTLYLSGVTAFGTSAQGKSVAEQTRAIFARIRAIAESEKTDMSSLIKVTIFITDIGKAQELREELARQYDGHPPASSLVEVNKLFSPEANIEIEAIFAL